MSSPVYSVEGSARKIPINFFLGLPTSYCSIVVEVVEASKGDILGPAGSHHVGFVYAWCYFATGQQTLTVLDIFKLSLLTSEIAS